MSQWADAQNNIQQMLNKAELIYDENPSESFSLCESAERKANQIGDHTQDGSIKLCKARYYILIAKYDAASKAINEAIMIFDDQNDLTNLAVAYQLKNILLFRVGDDEEAHHSLLKALDIYKQLEDEDGIVGVLMNLCLDYDRASDLDSMRFCLEELESKIDKADPSLFYFYYQNWGIYFMNLEDYARAIQQFELGLKVARKEKMTDSEATCLMYLSMAHQGTGQLNLADSYAEQSYHFSEENNLIYESFEALDQWIKVKEQKGDIQKAYDIQKKWIRVNNEINNLERIQKVKTIESQLELAEKENQIAESEIALQKSRLEGQREKTKNAWLIGIVGIVALLLSFTIFIYWRTRRLNVEIKKQKDIVELKSLHLEEALTNIQDSLHYSKLIQSSMLPAKSEFDKIAKENFVLYRPKDIVSGDFYWLHDFGTYQIIAVGDCTGHGVPGAMVSMVCNEAMNKVFIEQKEEDIAIGLDRIREMVSNTFMRNENEMSDGMDVSIIQIRGNQLKYVGANNNLWIYRQKNENLPIASNHIILKEFENINLIELKADKQPVGHYSHVKPFTSKGLLLHPGDKLYLFTDGYADQFGGDKGKKLKASNFKEILANAHALSLKDQQIHLENIFDEWKGELEQLDDVCLIGLRLT